MSLARASRRRTDVNTESPPGRPGLTQPFWTHARQLEKVPPCQAQCPNSGDIRGWLGIIAQHEKLGLSLEQAYDRAWEKLVQLNPLPATVGRICPHPCESRCSREAKDGERRQHPADVGVAPRQGVQVCVLLVVAQLTPGRLLQAAAVG